MQFLDESRQPGLRVRVERHADHLESTGPKPNRSFISLTRIRPLSDVTLDPGQATFNELLKES